MYGKWEFRPPGPPLAPSSHPRDRTLVMWLTSAGTVTLHALCSIRNNTSLLKLKHTLYNVAPIHQVFFYITNRAKQALGCCVRLASDPKDVFCRLLLLFTMNVIPDDEDAANNGQAQQVSTLYLANIGKVIYPAYVIDRPTPVFHSRDSLVAFAEAYQQKHEMLVALENNNFEQAYSYYPKRQRNLMTFLQD
ncbi:Fanconi-associated nuclease 1 [Desmophyllum pertusum]|uniref:Fanconi-associated nuclease n=1 Tax=Desmophyllum pertusum TaxID=174260 RepID=A0A9X0D4I9_9CNID|nr:Fanconi-associated nuclease 1 [Desmophyllum pertusum]